MNCDIGLVGLAVMGENLALNIESRGYPRRRLQPHDERSRRVHRRPCRRQEVRRLPLARRAGQEPGRAAQGDDDGQGRPGGRRPDRAAASAAVERATSSSTAATRYYADTERRTQVRRSEGPALHRHRRLRRRRRRAQRPQHDARRQPRQPGRCEADLSGDRRQGRPEERHPLLRMGRPARRRALREDGPQRHRVRRHAADLRSLLHAASRRSACRTTSCTTSSTNGTAASWTAT